MLTASPGSLDCEQSSDGKKGRCGTGWRSSGDLGVRLVSDVAASWRFVRHLRLSRCLGLDTWATDHQPKIRYRFLKERQLMPHIPRGLDSTSLQVWLRGLVLELPPRALSRLPTRTRSWPGEIGRVKVTPASWALFWTASYLMPSMWRSLL